MAGRLIPGQRTWSMTRDSEGHRVYKLVHMVEMDSPLDGPRLAMLTPGLPQVGDVWNIDNDYDPIAYCKLDVNCTPVVENEPNVYFLVEHVYSTKPDINRKYLVEFDNPLLIPPKVSVSFSKYQEEATHDRFGRPILNSAWEQVRGPQVEFDKSRPQVKVEMNVGVLNIGLLSAMLDTVNDRYMWGLPPRCVKLSQIGVQPNFYGLANIYYSLTLDFDIRVRKVSEFIIVTSASVSTPGLLYAVNEVVTLGAIGDPGVVTPATVLVLSVTGGGAIQTCRVVNPGVYDAVLTSPVAQGSTTGSGVGATFNLTWQNPVESDFDRNLLDEGTKVLNGRFTSAGTYITLPFEGQPPDPKNPKHFIRFKDPRGENCRVPLNGEGLPAGIVTGVGERYISITNGNLGNDITDEDNWIPIFSPVKFAEWDPETLYVKGELVTLTSPTSPNYKLYVQVADVTENEPPLISGDWLLLFNQDVDPLAQLVDAGNYSNATTYLKAEYIRDLTGTSSGTINVQKYEESNFFLLGVPTSIPPV